MSRSLLKITLLIAAFFVVGFSLLFWYYYSVQQTEQQSSFQTIKGTNMVCNQIVISADADLPTSTVNNYVEAIQGKIDQQIPQIHSFLITIPGKCDNDTINNAINYLKGRPGIQSADPNYIRQPIN